MPADVCPGSVVGVSLFECPPLLVKGLECDMDLLVHVALSLLSKTICAISVLSICNDLAPCSGKTILAESGLVGEISRLGRKSIVG